MGIQEIWLYMRKTYVPLFLIIGCPISILFLSKFGGIKPVIMTWTEMVFGNTTSLFLTSLMMFWAFLSLKVPAKPYYGPATYSGFRPRYQDNGFFYYTTTTILFFVIYYVYPSVPRIVYFNVPYLIASLNTTALILCGILWYKGKYYPQENEDMDKFPLIFEYFRGMEVHPRVFDVDVKQFTNCRFGMMSWQLLIYVYWIFSYETFGFNWGFTVSCTLQTMYIAKFFIWEVGYFTTIDIILDRAGFYICWGCMCFVLGLYAFPTYFLVAHPPVLGKWTALSLLLLGVLSIVLTYVIDIEKIIFRESNGKRCLWSDKPLYVKAECDTRDGKRESILLASGFWGFSRHLNYVFECACYYIWSLPGYNFGIWSFLSAIILTGILIQRTYRDEDKCLKKYGAAWQQYCKLVKYKFLPYIY